MKIILVRHGETEANRRRCFADSDEIPLTDAGRLQAHTLASRLAKEFRADVVLSSEFTRARQTSEIIARILGLPFEVIPGIHERNFGCLRGRAYERMGEAMVADTRYDPAKAWLWAPEGGESLADVQRRAMAALESARVRHTGRQVVVVCHGAVIQAVCAHITGEWTESFVPPNCGVVEIEYAPDGWARPVVSDDWEGLNA